MKLRNGKILNTKLVQRVSTRLNLQNRLSKNTTIANVFNNKNRGYPSIDKCHAKKWLTCPRLSTNNTVRSTFNGRTFSLNFETDITWKTNSIIYLLTWNKPGCGIQYVGETGRYLSKRTQEHLYRFKRPNKFKSIIYQHLKKHSHPIKYLTVQPLEVVNKQPGESHSKFVRSRKIIELNWIKKLQTVYPLGLNDNIMGIGNISRTNSVNILDIVSKTGHNRSHGRRKNRNQRKFRTNHTNISDLISISKNNGRHYLLTKLCSLPINKLNKILEDCNTISYYSPKYEIVQIIMAYCYSKLFPKIDRPEDHKNIFLK